MPTSRATAPRSREAVTAALFLAPFLIVYSFFLVYPFFKGIWISLHDWNVLAVAMNPNAKHFVGFENYRHMFWGRHIEWAAIRHPLLQGLCAVAALGAAYLHFARRIQRSSFFAALISAALFFFIFGWGPAENGRWFDRRFWPIVGNTILFVALVAPAITIISMALAAVLNRETKAMAVFRTIFFLSQVLSVTVVTLIWQIMFSPQQGLIAGFLAHRSGLCDGGDRDHHCLVVDRYCHDPVSCWASGNFQGDF
jgi:multiple sugar transport system permease protein